MTARLICFFIFLVAVSSVCPASADEIVLVNGDRLTGVVKSSDENTVVLETDYSEPVRISRSRIKRMYVETPAVIRLTSGEMLKGTIRSGEDGNVIIEEGPGRQAVTVAWSSVAALNPPPEHLSTWNGNVSVGAAMQSGNTDRSSAAVSAEAVRKTMNDRFSLRFLHNYAEEEDTVSARNTYGALKYDYFLTEKYYVYLATELLTDSFRDLKLRTVIGPGAGYQVWDDAVKSLLLEAGVSYFSEDLREGEDRDWVTGRLAGDVRYNLREAVVLSDNLVVYPGFEDFGEFSLRNEASIASPLAAGWSLKLSNILEHDSDPPEDIEKNDWYWLLGLQYGF